MRLPSYLGNRKGQSQGLPIANDEKPEADSLKLTIHNCHEINSFPLTPIYEIDPPKPMN
jgi:hypothetical protein